jgi:hypothetical protein
MAIMAKLPTLAGAALTRLAANVRAALAESSAQHTSFDGRLVATELPRRRHRIALEHTLVTAGAGSLALALDAAAATLERSDPAAAICARELANEQRHASWRRRLRETSSA